MATQYMTAPSYMAPSLSDGHSYPGGMDRGKNGVFSFRKRVERVDWRKIASVDVDTIARTLDFSTLQNNIMNITFCNLEAELDIRSVDPNFVKLFKLAQLTIEYLLHSQEYLAGLCASLEEKCKVSEQGVEKINKEFEETKKEVSEAKKESHKRKKLLIAQQQLMFAGSENYKKCPLCAKAFQDNGYLQAHILRRHAGAATVNGQGSSSASPDLGVGSDNSSQNMLLAEIGELKGRLLKYEERADRNSLKRKEAVILAANLDSQPSLDKIMKGEVEGGASGALMKELKEMTAKYHASEQALSEMENRVGVKRSNLGDLEDEIENEKEMIQDQRDEVAQLKSQLQQQLDQMSGHMQHNLEKQERKWQKKVHQMTHQHADDIRRLNNALEATTHATPRHGVQQKEVEDVLRRSREQEKALEFQEQMIEEQLNRSGEVKPIRNPHVTGASKRPGRKDPTPQEFVKHSSMYPNDEDEEASTAFGTGTSSLRTLDRDGLSTFGMTGTQSLRASQFLEELRKNPTLGVMREELSSLLQEHTEKKGIRPDQTGISDQVLENKLAMLNTQRQGLMQKYSNFLELRQQFNKKATEMAKKQLREQLGSPRGPPPADMSPLNTPGRQSYPSSPSTPYAQQQQQRRSRPQSGPPHPQQHLTSSSQRASSPSPRGRGSSLPSTPKASTPKAQYQQQQQQSPKQSNMALFQAQPSPKQQQLQQQQYQQQPQPQPRSKTPLSTGSTTEWTSTQYTSDSEDEEDEESTHQRGGQFFTQAPGPRLIQSGPARSGPPSPSPRAPKPRLIQSKPINLDDEDIDDLLESEEETNNHRGGAPSPSSRLASPKRSPGTNVSKLAGSLQHQLGNRNPAQKPFGGVDVMVNKQGQNNVDNLDDESDWDDTTAPNDPAPVNLRRPAVRASSEAMSSNTYGTSAWGGSSSKAASTVKDKDRRSTSRSSFVSVTDVSSDDDMNVDNI